VPRLRGGPGACCRFSIIAWGRRRRITLANAGANEELGPRPIDGGRPPHRVGSKGSHDTFEAAWEQAQAVAQAAAGATRTDQATTGAMVGGDSGGRSNTSVAVEPVALVSQLVQRHRVAATAAARALSQKEQAHSEAGAARKQRRQQMQAKNARAVLG